MAHKIIMVVIFVFKFRGDLESRQTYMIHIFVKPMLLVVLSFTLLAQELTQ